MDALSFHTVAVFGCLTHTRGSRTFIRLPHRFTRCHYHPTHTFTHTALDLPFYAFRFTVGFSHAFILAPRLLSRCITTFCRMVDTTVSFSVYLVFHRWLFHTFAPVPVFFLLRVYIHLLTVALRYLSTTCSPHTLPRLVAAGPTHTATPRFHALRTFRTPILPSHVRAWDHARLRLHSHAHTDVLYCAVSGLRSRRPSLPRTPHIAPVFTAYGTISFLAAFLGPFAFHTHILHALRVHLFLVLRCLPVRHIAHVLRFGFSAFSCLVSFGFARTPTTGSAAFRSPPRVLVSLHVASSLLRRCLLPATTRFGCIHLSFTFCTPTVCVYTTLRV